MRFLNKKSGQFVTVYPKHTQAVCALLRSQDYLVVNDAIWQEADHPRDTDGKFTSAGGGAEAPTTGKAVAPITTPATPALLSKPKAPTAKKKSTTAKEFFGESFKPNDLEPLSPQAKTKLESMYQRASEVKVHYDKINEGIAQELGGKYVDVPLKGTARAVEKILSDYDGDASKLKDLVRSTIQINSLSDVQKSIDKIKEKYGKPVKERNLLDPDKGSLFDTGYRDINMVVEIDGTYAEIQVNFAPMLKAKEGFHKHYEVIREMEAEANTSKRPLTQEEEATRTKLMKEMKVAYDSAWQEILASSKPS